MSSVFVVMGDSRQIQAETSEFICTLTSISNSPLARRVLRPSSRPVLFRIEISSVYLACNDSVHPVLKITV